MSERNPKVLIVATSRKTRGGITSVVKGHEMGDQWNKYQCKWIETHIDKGTGYKLLYFFKSFICFLFLLPRYDLVHIHMSEPPSAIRKVPFLCFAKFFSKKLIVHFHAFSPDTTINSKYKHVYQYLFLKADVVLVLSEYWKKEIQQAFELKSKVQVLYNPCVTPDYSHRYEKQKHILYAGTINNRKGYSDLIKAFARIAINFPEWEIVFAGNGEIENGKRLAKELKIDSQTVFLGWIDGEAKSKTFQEASIFCLPSYAEGFPMAVLDAWAYGLPIVTTPVGGLPDVLKDKENALVFDPGDIEGLANALRFMIVNESLRQCIMEESVKLAKDVFDPAVICSQLDQIYLDLLSLK